MMLSRPTCPHLVIGALACLLILSACAESNPGVPAEGPATTIPPNTLPLGDLLQALVDDYATRGFPGVVLLVDGGKDGFWAGTAGYARLEDRTPMTIANVHHCGSHPKLHTAVATLLLAEMGRIDLDTPIAQYLDPAVADRVPSSSRISVRQLLNHTSGLPEFDDSPALFFRRSNHPLTLITPEEILDVIAGLTPLHAPGAAHFYSGTNYILLTRIIDHVTGRDHGDFFKEHLYDPLGMDRTYYRVQESYYYPNLPPGLANMYEDRFLTGTLFNNTVEHHIWLTALPGCDGLISSPRDLARFLRALFTGDIFSTPESLDEMLTPVYDPSDDSYYGLGVFMSTDDRNAPDFYVGHSGSTEGSGTLAFYFPNRDYVVVAFVNLGTKYAAPGRLFWEGFWGDVRRILFSGSGSQVR
jgi:D-alanyl-D-alanine carboxypeptidase